MLTLCWGQPIVAWTARQLGLGDMGPAIGLGVFRGNRLIAGIAFRDFNGSNVEMVMASIQRDWCSRRVIKAAFGFAFLGYDANRVTVLIEPHNERAKRLVEGLGFKVEGLHPMAMPSGADTLSYGLLRRDCRWIEERFRFREGVHEVGQEERAKTP